MYFTFDHINVENKFYPVTRWYNHSLSQAFSYSSVCPSFISETKHSVPLNVSINRPLGFCVRCPSAWNVTTQLLLSLVNKYV